MYTAFRVSEKYLYLGIIITTAATMSVVLIINPFPVHAVLEQEARGGRAQQCEWVPSCHHHMHILPDNIT